MKKHGSRPDSLRGKIKFELEFSGNQSLSHGANTLHKRFDRVVVRRKPSFDGLASTGVNA